MNESQKQQVALWEAVKQADSHLPETTSSKSPYHTLKVTDHFKNTKGKTLVSFEVLPPLKGGSMQAIFKTLDALMEFKPPFIDVTYHREEFIYNKRPSGYYEKTAIRKRPGTVGICAAIMHRYGVDAVPHLICGGFSVEETENALIDLNFLGINNVLALRGDARQFEDKFVPETDGHKFALDLVRQIEGICFIQILKVIMPIFCGTYFPAE